MADGFERFSGFPLVIGAVDGCHIPIRTPLQYPQSYLNRLRSHSIILQVNFASVNSTSAHLPSLGATPGHLFGISVPVVGHLCNLSRLTGV